MKMLRKEKRRGKRRKTDALVRGKKTEHRMRMMAWGSSDGSSPFLALSGTGHLECVLDLGSCDGDSHDLFELVKVDAAAASVAGADRPSSDMG